MMNDSELLMRRVEKGKREGKGEKLKGRDTGEGSIQMGTICEKVEDMGQKKQNRSSGRKKTFRC